MKVGFVAPLSMATVNGGVRTQVLKTKEALNNLGVEVELISAWQDKLDVDLIHVFTISAEMQPFIQNAKANGFKVVLSPVFYSTRSSSVIRRIVSIDSWISKTGLNLRNEYGIKSELCNSVDLLLPNTSEESRLIQESFGVSAFNIQVVTNGVETHFQHSKPDLFIQNYGLRDFVLFAGHAGAGRKNVISLLKAAKNIEREIVIIGSFYEDEYGNTCRKLGSEAGNVTFIDTLPHDSELLASAYAASKVFVLPSLFETPGIAAMEAALAGSNIAITEIGGTKDYFKEMAEYLDPFNVNSISNAINRSLKRESTDQLKRHILSNYTWQQTAELSLSAYKKLLS